MKSKITNETLEDQIDWKKIINTLILSKKLIIVITLITALISLGYVFSQNPMYQSEAKIKFNHTFTPKTFPELTNIFPELSYVYSNTAINQIGSHIIVLKTTNRSIEKSENELNKAISYIVNAVNSKIINNEGIIKNIEQDLAFLDKNEDKEINNFAMVIYELNKEKRLIESQNNDLMFSKTELITTKIQSHMLLFTLIGAILGFSGSIFILLLRNSILEQLKN